MKNLNEIVRDADYYLWKFNKELSPKMTQDEREIINKAMCVLDIFGKIKFDEEEVIHE